MLCEFVIYQLAVEVRLCLRLGMVVIFAFCVYRGKLRKDDSLFITDYVHIFVVRPQVFTFSAFKSLLDGGFRWEK